MVKHITKLNDIIHSKSEEVHSIEYKTKYIGISKAKQVITSSIYIQERKRASNWGVRSTTIGYKEKKKNSKVPRWVVHELVFSVCIMPYNHILYVIYTY